MNIENLTLRTRQCQAIVPTTGDRCKRQAVNPGTTQKKVIYDPRTGERKKVPVINKKGEIIMSSVNFCEMHQLNKIPTCRCKCHNTRVNTGPTFVYRLTDEQINSVKRGAKMVKISVNQSEFGNKPVKKKKQVKRNSTKEKHKK
jgi:hypothetical protein